MSLADLSSFCTPLPSNGQLCVTMPGGGVICATFPGATPPSPDELVNALLASLSPALANLMPYFDVIGVLVALVDCLKAVEKCIGPPPNPTKLIQCFPKLATAVAKVLETIPELSVPVMIAGIVNALVTFLQGLRAQILTILNKLLRLLSAQIRVNLTGSVQLQTVVDCANTNLAGFLSGMSSNAQPIACIVSLINALLDLIGLPELPLVLSIGANPATLEAFLTPLDDIILVLQAFLLAFPMGGAC